MALITLHNCLTNIITVYKDRQSVADIIQIIDLIASPFHSIKCMKQYSFSKDNHRLPNNMPVNITKKM